ncbi:hypothetical protein [Paenibacillus agilis]|uniref:Uncharacterized protein n=1 Tax=Paenibacillus agilis TaxID=3020863 RepID=A0A559J137_9BACL|nr:hypothetical protein [Paenibacillus agilis]TVX93556.1 hypothetical protein FPZ44_11125 [Paenibacillus agilis]
MAKKMRLGQRYARIMTRTYTPFAMYVTFFIALIIWSSSSVDTNVFQTYKSSIHETKASIFIDDEIKPSSDIIYIYTDKNQNLYKFQIKDVTQVDGATYVSVHEIDKLLSLTSEFMNKQLYAEIPSGKVSLLRRMVPLGE